MKDFKFTACAPPGCSCPVLEVEDDVVYIHDDYGHVVQMTTSQMYMMANRFATEYINANLDRYTK